MSEGRWTFHLPRPRIARIGPGRFALRLPQDERDLLRNLVTDLRELAQGTDPSTRRLFPAAYHDDAEKEREYQELMRGELVASRLAAVDVVTRTIDADSIDLEALNRWMEAINGLRLVIGTRLDVTEELPELDDQHPDAPALAVYEYLAWLLDQAVQAMTVDMKKSGPGKRA
jgi:hypothetical protein